jgi:hypothetical protein
LFRRLSRLSLALMCYIIGVVLQVRWSGEHVPGSPFVVMIFDTEEELNRFP